MTLQTEFAQALTGGPPLSKNPPWWIGLFTNSAEITGGSYARVSADFEVLFGWEIINSGVISFPVATAPWTNITRIGIAEGAASAPFRFLSTGSNNTVPVGFQARISGGALSLYITP